MSLKIKNIIVDGLISLGDFLPGGTGSLFAWGEVELPEILKSCEKNGNA